MPDYTVSGDVDSMLRSANDAGIRSAIGVGTTDAPTFLKVIVSPGAVLTNGGVAFGSEFELRSAATNTLMGFWRGNSFRALFGGTALHTCSLGSIGFSDTSTDVSVTDTLLWRDAAGILAQRNGVNAQAFRVYNSTDATPATNFDRASFGFASNVLRIGTENGGTYTTARPIEFVTGGAIRMSIAAGGGVAIPLGGLTITSGGANITGIVNATALISGFYVQANTQFMFGTGGVGDVALQKNATGVVEINSTTAGVFRDLRCRSVIQQPPATITPASNGDLVVEATSNTLLTFKYKGSDGTVRSGTMVVA